MASESSFFDHEVSIGDWLLHCHIIEHQKSGMTSYVRVV
nr:multicopper oxidase domain-containing protein [Mesorhizobium metallidurans]